MKEVASTALWVYSKAYHLPHALVSAPGVRQGRILYDFLDPKMGYYRHLREPRASLATLLELQSTCLVSEPRDRVFSITGLSHLAKNVPLPLRPDYGRTVRDVFLDAVWTALNERGVHRILLFVSHPNEEHLCRRGWPSWLPPWDRHLDTSKDARRLYRNSPERVEHSPIVPPRDLEHPEQLKLGGFRIAKIAACTSTLGGFTPDQFLTWFDNVEQVTRMSEFWGHVAFLLMRGKTAERTEATESDSTPFNDLMTFLRESGSSKVPLDGALKGANDAVASDIMRYAIALKNACLHRTLFRTSQGDIGLGPGISQPNDAVVKFAAAHPPYVLRADTHGRYRVLGHCYVYGMVENEEVKQSVLTQLRTEDFVLV